MSQDWDTMPCSLGSGIICLVKTGKAKEGEGQVQDQNQVYVQVQNQDRETLLGGGMIDLPS